MTLTPQSVSVQTERNPGSVRVDFTDGDTYKRVTVTDAGYTLLGPPPVCSVVRDQISDGDDPGWHFTACPVAGTADGSFDVAVSAQMWDGPADPYDPPPNETVTLVYTLIR